MGSARACQPGGDASARGREPPGERAGGREREDQHRRAPGTAEDGQRHGERRRDRGTDLDAAGVDAGDEQRAVREALLDGHHHERVAQAHADGDRHVSAITANAPGRTARATPPPAIRARAKETARMAPDPRGQRRCGRREHAHADHRDRGEQRRHGVADPERVLGPRQDRAEPHQLRPQREGGEPERRRSGRGVPAAHRRHSPVLVARLPLLDERRHALGEVVRSAQQPVGEALELHGDRERRVLRLRRSRAWRCAARAPGGPRARPRGSPRPRPGRPRGRPRRAVPSPAPRPPRPVARA